MSTDPPRCPLCGRTYTRPPALSRRDNKTPICSTCGIREALRWISLPEEQIENILKQIEETAHE